MSGKVMSRFPALLFGSLSRRKIPAMIFGGQKIVPRGKWLKEIGADDAA